MGRFLRALYKTGSYSNSVILSLSKDQFGCLFSKARN